MPVRAEIASYAIKYMDEYLGFDFTLDEFNFICDKHKISNYINRGGEFATGERETFYDALAKEFTGFDHWPTNGENEIDSKEFTAQLVAGYAAFKEGKPNPHDPKLTGYVLVHRSLLHRAYEALPVIENKALRRELKKVSK